MLPCISTDLDTSTVLSKKKLLRRILSIIFRLMSSHLHLIWQTKVLLNMSYSLFIYFFLFVGFTLSLSLIHTHYFSFSDTLTISLSPSLILPLSPSIHIYQSQFPPIFHILTSTLFNLAGEGYARRRGYVPTIWIQHFNRILQNARYCCRCTIQVREEHRKEKCHRCRTNSPYARI